MKSAARRLVLALVSLAAVPSPSLAQRGPPGLIEMSIEDLMRVEITTASRKEQRAVDVPAAVFVITSDDIRRSGMTSIPDLLRLAPGVQVAQINSSNWAVSIRGFNGQFSNKLLVLVDGRSIYKRSFSGVFWDAEDVQVDDIDRIEVVRGPGGAVWGANAVNGVVNIVTKPAASTQGAHLNLRVGTLDRAGVFARYGGSVGSAAYRVYSQWTDRGDTRLADGQAAHDDWSTLTNGARVDWSSGADEWTVDGSVKIGEGRPLWRFATSPAPGVALRTDKIASFHTGSVLGRWTHRGANASALQVQSFVAISRRSNAVEDNAFDNENTFDTELQYHARLGARHDMVVGGGYRFIDNAMSPSFGFSMTPPASRATVVSVFAQDEIAIASRLRLTLGTKLERDTIAGSSLQPSVRVMWRPAPGHHVWFSASRAPRTPSNTDLALRVNAVAIAGPGAPVLIGALGNPDYRTEEFQDAEVGYRLEVGSRLAVDATAFRGHYSRLPTNEPLAPVFEPTPSPPHLFVATRLENLQEADTVGFELAARFAPTTAWQLTGAYSSFHLTPHPDASSRDTAAATFDGSAPAHQWQLRSTVRLGSRTELDAGLFRTGALRSLGVPAYTRADARVEVRLTGHLSAVTAAKNLFGPPHAEFVTHSVVSTWIQRSADVQLVWRF